MLSDSASGVAKAAIQSAVRFIQSHFQESCGAVLAEALLPAFLCRLGYSDADGEIRALLVKALLLLVSAAPEQQKGGLVELLVTPLCDKMCRHADDAAFLALCGKGFTHLARLCPDAFRGQVAQLSESHRGVLQRVMMQAMQSQQQAEGGGAQQSGGAGAAPPAMKINMAKYKNSAT